MIEAVARCSVKKVFKNFAKLTSKHLCKSLFFDKVAGLIIQPATLKVTLTQVFCREFQKTFKNTFFVEQIRWLLLEPHFY